MPFSSMAWPNKLESISSDIKQNVQRKTLERKRKDEEKEKNTLPKTITEYKCTCNECGKIWHYLKSEEQQMNTQQCSNAMLGCGTCCSPIGAYFSNKSMEVGREAASKFKKCPNCGSINIKKEERTVEKPKGF